MECKQIKWKVIRGVLLWKQPFLSPGVPKTITHKITHFHVVYVLVREGPGWTQHPPPSHLLYFMGVWRYVGVSRIRKSNAAIHKLEYFCRFGVMFEGPLQLAKLILENIFVCWSSLSGWISFIEAFLLCPRKWNSVFLSWHVTVRHMAAMCNFSTKVCHIFSSVFLVFQ